MIHNKFHIIEDPWWRPKYCQPQEVNAIASKIERLQLVVKKEVSADNFWKGYVEFHHKKYLLECVCGESNIKMKFEDVENLLNVGCCQKMYYWIFHRKHVRLIRKLHNLNGATLYLFPNIFSFEVPSLENFDLKFIKLLHYKIGKGIIDNAGEFRKNYAKPAGEDLFYLEPKLIEEKLQQLLKECKLMFFDSKLELLDAVKYGACFLANFLYIHPFSNGNGRTGRLLLSYLLTRFTIVPLSLYTSGEMREAYLQCLRETRYDLEIMKPGCLSRFILEAIEKEFMNYCSIMDVKPN